MVVDARRAVRIVKCAAAQQWSAFQGAFLSCSRAIIAQERIQTCVPLLRRRAFRNVRAPCVDRHTVVDA
eukprot:9121616-Lingulodinium_polyedra.AAC.1